MRFSKKYFVANWKMNKNLSESLDFLEKLKLDDSNHNVWIAPAFCNITAIKQKFPKLSIGAQNLSYRSHGAYTGEVSAGMLSDLEVKFCIIGHSERRKYFHETDEEIGQKVALTVQEGMLPILCVGETLEQNEKGLTHHILDQQIKLALELVKTQTFDLFIAYEPVWAIGSSKPATAQIVKNVLSEIKEKVLTIAPKANLKLLYGGSVTLDNIDEYLSTPLVDGVLVGGASLELQTFQNFIK